MFFFTKFKILVYSISKLNCQFNARTVIVKFFNKLKSDKKNPYVKTKIASFATFINDNI